MKELKKLTVLAIDCQATQSNPQAGHLVEIGWVKTKADRPFDHEMTLEKAKALLVKTGKNAQMPKKFLQITGIGTEEMKEAVSKKAIWGRLQNAAKKTASANQGICPAVIHFSRYEGPFLERLHEKFSPNGNFPFEVICTHKIVSRLYPGLPRKSLRAVAGYFGYALPEFRRSLNHVVATAFIWNHLVDLLEAREKITTFQELQTWLHSSPTPSISAKRTRKFPMEKALRQDLPDKPGIYRMYRTSGDLLYIGKAKSLKTRVKSYFHEKGRHAEHILEMLSQAQNLTTFVTQSAFEAAVRESDEIKRHDPPYNRALRQNERSLLFYAKDFRCKQTTPDARHPIGPLPFHIDMESLATLIDALNGKIREFSPRSIETVLWAPSEYAPDEDCFKQGLDIFQKEYIYDIRSPIHVGHMMKWGALFWEEKMVEKAREEQNEPEEDTEGLQEDDEQEKMPEGWTPERVFKALKRMIRIGAFNIRRARWFCRLSESILIWTPSDSQEENKNQLVLENGTTDFRKICVLSPEIKSPPGHKKTLRARQESFDIATYDRMRIVTTEIRRIIQEGRKMEVIFHPGVSLKTGQLAEMLKWI